MITRKEIKFLTNITKKEIRQLELVYKLRTYIMEIETSMSVQNIPQTLIWIKSRNFIIAYLAYETPTILTDEQVQKIITENAESWFYNFNEAMSGRVLY